MPRRYCKRVVNTAATVRFFRRAKVPPALSRPVRLHIGCGENSYRGWVNIDREALRGVDYVLDVRRGLPFENVAAIYAEHFLEHLSLEEGLAFLRECRRVLSPEGVLRVSTPNLDWVLLTHYHYGQWASDKEADLDCVRINRAFHGWGHQFLYNRQMLTSVLRASGFPRISFHRYGESSLPEMRGLERHETWEDTPDLPHVLVAEASGQSETEEGLSRELLREYRLALTARPEF